MSRRYDQRVTTFSPDGRLFQVEYALEAISHAGACVGVQSRDGVVLAAERRVLSKLLDSSTRSARASEKMYEIDAHVGCVVAGITSDANSLVNRARQAAQRYRNTYHEAVPVEYLVRQIADVKQGYTQFGGLRPFGVSILYAGWDRHYGYQLYASDPSGNYGGWRAIAIGQNQAAANSLLRQEYPEGNDAAAEVSLEQAMRLVAWVFAKTADVAMLDVNKLEVTVVGREPGAATSKRAEQEEAGVVFRAVEDEQLQPVFEDVKRELEASGAPGRTDVNK